MSGAYLISILPELFILSMILLVTMADVFKKNKNSNVAYVLTQLTLIGAFVINLFYFNNPSIDNSAFYGQIKINDMTILLKLITYLSAFFVLTYSRPYIKNENIHRGEFYILFLLLVVGACVLISANNLLTIYIGLELLSLPLYAIIAIRQKSGQGAEAALKYFILGAIASGILLYGMSFIYGITGSLGVTEIANYLSINNDYKEVVLFAMVFFIVVGAFKLGAAPFHQWVPDVYTGSPNVVTAILATVPKIASYAMVFTILTQMLASYAVIWSQILLVLGIISVFLGNIVAIVQTNIKKMLAYSSISHIGFLFLALSMSDSAGYSASLYYIIVYALMSSASFGVILMLSKNGKDITEINDLKGLNYTHPWLAFMMMFVMLSMAGIPPFIGFTAKVLVLSSLVYSNFYGVAIFVLLMSVVGSYYYLNIVRVMYFTNKTKTPQVEKISKDGIIAITINSGALLFFGIFPLYLSETVQLIFGS